MAVPGTNFFFGLRERTLVRSCIRGVKALPQTVREAISFRFSGFANQRLIAKDGQIFIQLSKELYKESSGYGFSSPWFFATAVLSRSSNTLERLAPTFGKQR